MLAEIAKWLGANYPLLLAVLITVGFFAGLVRGFDAGSFHWPGFTDLWHLNGDRKRHEFEQKQSHITYSDRGIAREKRKWRCRVRDVIRDPAHHRISIDFIGNEGISEAYVQMWREIVVEFSKSCYFYFLVIGGGIGQSKLLEMLLQEQFEMVENKFERTGKVDLDVPLQIHTSVTRTPAPNKLIYNFCRDRKDVLK